MRTASYGSRQQLAEAVVSRRILAVLGFDDVEAALSILQEIVSDSSDRAKRESCEAAKSLSRVSEKP